jgi:phage terminase large subunit-like protein
MTVLLFVANSARSWDRAITNGFSGTNAQRQRISRVRDRVTRTYSFSASFDAPMGL